MSAFARDMVKRAGAQKSPRRVAPLSALAIARDTPECTQPINQHKIPETVTPLPVGSLPPHSLTPSGATLACSLRPWSPPFASAFARRRRSSVRESLLSRCSSRGESQRLHKEYCMGVSDRLRRTFRGSDLSDRRFPHGGDRHTVERGLSRSSEAGLAKIRLYMCMFVLNCMDSRYCMNAYSCVHVDGTRHPSLDINWTCCAATGSL